jgi:hypothetical protein
VAKLAEGGHVQEALAITRSILGFPRTRPARDVEVGDRTVAIRGAPLGNLDTWAYERFIDTVSPSLSRQASVDFMDLLADTLDEALLAEFEPEGRDAHRDGSYIWLREVEAAAEQPAHEYKTTLVPRLRDAAATAAEGPEGAVAHVVALLKQHPWPVHTRVALHVARSHAAAEPTLVRDLLLDHDLFALPEYRHEYSRLLGDAFATLDAPGRDTILGWVADGPRPDAQPEMRDVWQRNRLAPIRGFLPDEWTRRFADLVARYGEPTWQADSLIGPTQFWTGPTSPVTPEQLHEMAVPDVIALLGSWQPSGEWQSPSPEGLGRALAADVPTRPANYVLAAQSFADLDPVYAANLLSGLRGPLATPSGIDLSPLLRLATRIVEDRVAPPARPATLIAHLDALYDWHGTRRDLAHLLEVVTNSDQLSEAQDQLVWHCLRVLLTDPDPNPADEERFGSGMGAINYSLNCVRGQATHAVAALLGHLVRTGRHDETIAGEVKQAITDRLDPAVETSAAVRAAIAMNLRWFPSAGREWAASLVPRLFSDDPLGRVAWAATLRFGGLPGALMDAIWPILERALHAEAWQHDPEALAPTLHFALELFLGDHRVPIDLREAVQIAWPLASAESRAHEVITIGNWLSRDPERRAASARLAELIDLIIEVEATLSPDSEGRRRGLEPIGWVIATKALPLESTLSILNRILELGALPMDPEKVIGVLADGMERDDLQEAILTCLARLVALDRDNWAVYGGRAHVAAIVAAGKESHVPGIAEQARDIESALLTAGRANPAWFRSAPTVDT